MSTAFNKPHISKLPNRLGISLVILTSALILQVKKFMVGYEMLAQSQRDLTAEQVSNKQKQWAYENSYYRLAYRPLFV